MKILAIAFAAAALASACASTTPQHQLASNNSSCSAQNALRAADSSMANMLGGRIVGDAGASCAASRTGQGMTPAALHQRVTGDSPTRRGMIRN